MRVINEYKYLKYEKKTELDTICLKCWTKYLDIIYWSASLECYFQQFQPDLTCPWRCLWRRRISPSRCRCSAVSRGRWRGRRSSSASSPNRLRDAGRGLFPALKSEEKAKFRGPRKIKLNKIKIRVGPRNPSIRIGKSSGGALRSFNRFVFFMAQKLFYRGCELNHRTFKQ